MRRHTPQNRNRGLTLISRANRWMIAAAVGVTGLVSIETAGAFHSHTSTTTTTSTSSTPAASSDDTTTRTSSSGNGLQQPTQAPAASSAPASGSVTSGGS